MCESSKEDMCVAHCLQIIKSDMAKVKVLVLESPKNLSDNI